MALDDNKNNSTNNEPATLPGPAPYEEELKDYEHEGEEDLIDNLPEAHPATKPSEVKKS